MSFRVTIRRRIAAALIVALAALTIWHRIRIHAPAATLQSAARSSLRAAHAVGAGTGSAGEAATPAADPHPAGGGGSEGIDVCGYGRLAEDPKELQAAYNHVALLTHAAQERWLEALRTSDDYRARAAGLYFVSRLMNAAPPAGTPDEILNAVSRSADESGGTPLRAAAEARDELVQLAVGAGDPAVYALALYACDGPAAGSAAACRRLSFLAWARMDADNGVPWLIVAGEAQKRHDPSAETEAFGRAASAQKFDAYSDSLFAFGEPEIPADATPLERARMGVAAIGIEAATPQPMYSVASHHCSSDALRDDRVRQQCTALAELMVSKGTNVVDFALGASLGRQAGWPQARIDALRQEKDAMLGLMIDREPPPERAFTCEAVRRSNAFIHERARLGETAAIREAIERSGEPISVLARRWDAYLEKIQREYAQRAADAPPATLPDRSDSVR